MIREYPPMLTGKPEEQLMQLRAYLVRLIGYIDEMTAPAAAPDLTALGEWQTGVNNAIGSLRAAVGRIPLVQTGEVTETAAVVFPTAYSGEPAVFATAGTVSGLSPAGFTLTTTGNAKWIAVGNPRR